MKDKSIGRALNAAKTASTLLVLFIPSHDRKNRPVDQDQWGQKALATLGRLFGGATAFPRGKGVWRDDDQGGRLLFDDPVVIQCYTTMSSITKHASALRDFLVGMGRATQQGAVGFVIDRNYMEISFPA